MADNFLLALTWFNLIFNSKVIYSVLVKTFRLDVLVYKVIQWYDVQG